MNPHQISRRTVLTGTAAVAATATLAQPSYADRRREDSLADLERRYGRRIGVYAANLRTGKQLTNRADEPFAMCSTFKTLAVAAVLAGRLVVPDRQVLQRPVYYPPSLVTGAGYAPRLGAWQDEGYTPTVEEVCEVTLADSDNAGGNWLLQLIGGPGAVSKMARQLGDQTTTLTRWEPALNDWRPASDLDTTTPRAIGTSYARLLAGDALPRAQRRRLIEWMLASRTGAAALRKGLPDGWRIAEKTGSGTTYGTRNDVGVAWSDRGDPVVISCLTRSDDPDAASTDADPALAEVGRRCAQRLG